MDQLLFSSAKGKKGREAGQEDDHPGDDENAFRADYVTEDAGHDQGAHRSDANNRDHRTLDAPPLGIGYQGLRHCRQCRAR